jgi:hypothetical protein
LAKAAQKGASDGDNGGTMPLTEGMEITGEILLIDVASRSEEGIVGM